MTISFQGIPVGLRVPGSYIEISGEKAYRGLPGYPAKMLVIGQKLTAGSVAPLTPVLITSVDQANVYFGAASQLAHMIAKVKAANTDTECWAIAQADNVAAVAAAGQITITGPATAAGTINLYIAGRLVQIAVAAAATAATVATALAAAINANTALPVAAVVNAVDNYKVDITARNAGLNGNFIDIRTNIYQDQVLPAGINLTVTAMTGGSANPDVTNVMAAIGDDWYTAFIMAYGDTANIAVLESTLATRFGPLKMLEGHGYIGYADTHSNLVTKGQSRNSKNVSAIGANGSPTPPWEWAATLGAVCAFNLQIDPARPVQRLELPGILPPKINQRFTRDERELLLKNGISTFTVTSDGKVQIERVITEYRLNSANAADPSFLDIETLHTLSYLRWDVRTLIALRFPRHKLANDGTRYAQGQAVVTPRVIRDTLIARFFQWEEAGLVEGAEQFKKDLIVERDTPDPNRVNVRSSPDIINQFRVLAEQVEFLL